MILPSPYDLRGVTGSPENHYIHDGYQPREETRYFDDTVFADEFQREVYAYARQVADRISAKIVADVGCGSGFKLMQLFSDFDTVGVDLPKTVAFLQTRYPGRRWYTPALEPVPLADLVLCSDVIEHVLYPDKFLDYLTSFQPSRIVLSTPDRDNICSGTDHGPPRNEHHVREWSLAEFHAFVGSRLRVHEHFCINGCQIVEASCNVDF